MPCAGSATGTLTATGCHPTIATGVSLDDVGDAANALDLLLVDAAVGFEDALRVDPARAAFGRTHGSLRTHQQIVGSCANCEQSVVARAGWTRRPARRWPAQRKPAARTRPRQARTDQPFGASSSGRMTGFSTGRAAACSWRHRGRRRQVLYAPLAQ